jgi:Ca2+-dependent lipid-binding protein
LKLQHAELNQPETLVAASKIKRRLDENEATLRRAMRSAVRCAALADFSESWFEDLGFSTFLLHFTFTFTFIFIIIIIIIMIMIIIMIVIARHNTAETEMHSRAFLFMLPSASPRSPQ